MNSDGNDTDEERHAGHPCFGEENQACGGRECLQQNQQGAPAENTAGSEAVCEQGHRLPCVSDHQPCCADTLHEGTDIGDKICGD